MTDKSYPPAVAPVRGVRVTVDGVRRSSNWQFAALLLDDAGRGRNPLELPRDLLTAAGHPKRTVAQVRYAFACNAAGQYVPEDRPSVSRLSAVPSFCDDLCGDARRNCAVIDCPMWAYRFGDPHSGNRRKAMPRGVLFASKRPSLDATPARLHTGPNPATAPVLSDAAQPKLPRNSRAASAHRKDSNHG